MSAVKDLDCCSRSDNPVVVTRGTDDPDMKQLIITVSGTQNSHLTSQPGKRPDTRGTKPRNEALLNCAFLECCGFPNDSLDLRPKTGTGQIIRKDN
jgi:hypothetical protein